MIEEVLDRLEGLRLAFEVEVRLCVRSRSIDGDEGGVAEKSRANIEQVKARGGRVISVGSDPLSHEIAEEGVLVPQCSEWLSPILNVVPLQLLSYHVASLRGCDIDKPRNLAKSVTVE